MECGFVRNPSRKEVSVREYSISDSPRVVENRLVFQLGDICLPVSNVFYVSEYQNVSCDNVTEYVKVVDCDGTMESVRAHTMSADNRFYVTYVGNDVMSVPGSKYDGLSDRSSESSERRFRDGVYR